MWRVYQASIPLIALRLRDEDHTQSSYCGCSGTILRTVVDVWSRAKTGGRVRVAGSFSGIRSRFAVRDQPNVSQTCHRITGSKSVLSPGAD